MNKRAYLVIIIYSFCLCLVYLHAVNPFDKRITSAENHLVYVNPASIQHTEAFFSYTQTEPALIDTIISVPTTTIASETTTNVVVSSFEQSFQTIGDLTKVEYYEYRDYNTTLYGYYKFVFNPDGDLMEFMQQHPTLGDSMHVYYRYRNINQPDSMYYKTCTATGSTISYYLMYYDQIDRLTSSIWYLYDYEGWIIYRRFVSNYSANPYHYTNPLDYNNIRFYNLFWAGLESTSPIFDKNYAPSSISYEYFDNWEETWYPITSTYYGVDYNSEEIILLNGRDGEYDGFWYIDLEGNYTHSVYNRADGAVFLFNVNWENDTSNEDPVTLPAQYSISVKPNPFINSLKICIESKELQYSDISIYNIKGQLIRNWKNVKAEELSWDGRDNNNSPASGGIYLIQVRQGNSTSCRKVIKL